MHRVGIVVLVLALAGCATDGAAPAGAVLPGGRADYQLGGPYDPAPGTTIVARDSTEQPAPGVFGICYVNGFQTQPGDDWPSDLLLQVDGEPLVDPAWPDEVLLDVSTPEQRERAAERIGVAIERCAASGFDAVEFDNLDSWTRSGGLLDEEDAVAFATLLVARAHAAGLPAGQKNAPELVERGRAEVGFDFAIAEECARFDECAAYTDAYGADVIDIEYADDLPRPFAQLCAEPSTPPLTVLRDRDLSPAGDPEHVFEHC